MYIKYVSRSQKHLIAGFILYFSQLALSLGRNETETFETMKEKQPDKLPKNDAKREHRVAFMLNKAEYKAVECYLRKYKITNKSKWYRTTILSHIWKIM